MLEDILIMEKNTDGTYSLECKNIQQYLKEDLEKIITCSHKELLSVCQYFYNKGYEEGKKSRSFVSTQPFVPDTLSTSHTYAISNSK